MHVLVVGATGVLGRAAIPRLIQAGHRVTGIAGVPEGLVAVDRLGAAPVRADILDADGIARAIAEQRPEIVVNVATAIPRRLKIDPPDWERNDRIRTDGTRALVRACEASGVRLLVQESVGYVCAPAADDLITEQSPLSSHPFLRSTIAMERIVRASTVPGVLLRFAALMAPDAWHTRQTVAVLRRGLLPVIGRGDAFFSMIHADDAAEAICLACRKLDAAGGQTFNVVDDQPATSREVFDYAAALLSAPKPKGVPPFLAKVVAGATTVEVLAASYRMSNAKIRSELGFAPKFPTHRETWRQIADALKGVEISVTDE